MFLDHSLFEDLITDQFALTAQDRAKLKAYLARWLAEQAGKSVQAPTWVAGFKPRVDALCDSLSFVYKDEVLTLAAATADQPTLILLSRGSRLFNRIDQLPLKLWGVVIAQSHAQ